MSKSSELRVGDCEKAAGLPHEWDAWASVAVLSAHSDDAAFSVGGTLHLLVQAGKTVELITCFTVSAYTRFLQPLSAVAVTALRKSEDVRYCQTLGPKSTLTWLRQLDAPMRGYSVGAVCDNLPLSDADHILAEAIFLRVTERMRPDGVIFAPLAIGAHIDHRILREAATKLVKAAVAPTLFYEDMPYAAWQRPTVTLRAALGLGAELECAMIPRVISWPGIVRVKALAASCYLSQVAPEVIAEIASSGKRTTSRYAFERIWELHCTRGHK